jgi:transposase
MLTQPARLWLCTVPTDMRKQFDGLVALARNHLGGDPLSGHGFVFVNRRRTQLKLLYFDTDGFCIWSKRLEQGQFGIRHSRHAESVALSRTEFDALVEGLDLEIRKRRKRWRKTCPDPA